MPKKIAFFDSGIGGLTVLHQAMQQMPSEQFIYYADSDNAPYGTKTSTEITALVEDAVTFLAQQNIKALVLACNTATAVTAKALRARYPFPVIGMEPAVKPALKQTSTKKVLVCATEKTLKETKLSHLIQQLNAESKVDKLSLQQLVLLAEKGLFETPEVRIYLETAFKEINWQEYDALVLGCTHFLYYKNLIQRMIPATVSIVDGHQGTVQQLQRCLIQTEQTNQGSLDFYTSQKRQSNQLLEPFFNRIRSFT